MAVGKEIRTKISSIQSTQKITSAMEMVAASKMRKAQDRMEVGKPYARRMRSVVGHLPTPPPSTATCTWKSGRSSGSATSWCPPTAGLCGGLNINLFKATVKSMKEWADQNIEIDLCLVGAKAAAFFGSYGGNVTAAVRDLGEEPTLSDLIGGVKTMLDAYEEGKIDRLFLVSNEFVNTMTQNPDRSSNCCPWRRKDERGDEAPLGLHLRARRQGAAGRPADPLHRDRRCTRRWWKTAPVSRRRGCWR